MRTNPVKYADFFDVTKDRKLKGTKRGKMDCSENKKTEGKNEKQRYMINKHSGHLQPLELVQNLCKLC